MSGDVLRVLDGAIPPAENTRLFGHDEAAALLASAYAGGKLHHAILIEGAEGIGKATLAFRLANHVLAHPDPATAPAFMADPDPDSAGFRTVAAGASHNVFHLVRPADEKTGRLKTAITVEEVRRLGRFLGQTSGNGNWRIVIIDVADELNRSAANALLKMLEEPPRRAMFLVLSHHPGRLLPTIRSRCMPLVLRPLGAEAMRAAIRHLGLPIAPDRTEAILAAAGGSVATAIKLVNYGGLDIVDAFDEIFRKTGGAQRKAMHKLAEVLSGRDRDEAYDFFADHVGQHVSALARQAALAGDTSRADRLARFHSQLFERLTVSDAYNLDRKQTILTVLGDLAQTV